MNVSQAMSPKVFSCRPADSMDRAAQIMWEHDCGCVPVLDDENKVRGMLTDRDITMASYTKGAAPSALPVDQAMSQEAICCHGGDALQSALKSMSEHQLHRLPVVDDEQHLIGMLSLADVAQAVGRERAAKGRQQLADALLATLTRVSAPREGARAEGSRATGKRPTPQLIK